MNRTCSNCPGRLGIAPKARAWCRSRAMRCRSNMKASWPSICGRRENAGLFDVSRIWGRLILSGEGVAAALEALLPSDISALKAGCMRYSLLLAEDGGILDDLMVSRGRQGYYLVVNGAVKSDDIAYLRAHLPDAHHDQPYGRPRFAGVARAKGGCCGGRACHWRMAALCADIHAFWSFRTGGVRLWISRSGYTGEDGFEISVPAVDARHWPMHCARSPK